MEPEHLRLDDARRDALLRRMGLPMPPSVDLEGLRRLYRAWLRTVPFCSSRKRRHYGSEPDRAGPLPVMTAPSFVDGFLADGTGGTCFPTAEAFHQTLVACGFAARRAIGSMLDFAQIPGPNHGTVIVTIDARDYLVDPFFGSDDPLPLDGDAAEAGPDHLAIRYEAAGGADREPLVRWRFHTGPEWFRFGFDSRYPVVEHALFAERYERSGGDFSVFNSHLYISRHGDEQVLTIFRNTFYRLRADGQIDKRPLETGERDRLLTEHFGIDPAMAATIPPDLS